MRKIIWRWVKEEEVALRQLFNGKSANERFRGLRRSERNEAKLFLLALAPPLASGMLVGKWSNASTIGKSVIILGALWMAGVIIFGGILLFRALVRASKR